MAPQYSWHHGQTAADYKSLPSLLNTAFLPLYLLLRDPVFKFSFSREHQVHRKGLCTGFLCLQQKLPALRVSCILLQYHFLSVCPLLSEAPLSRCCGHPDLRISFPTPTTDSSSCCKGQQLSTLSCQPSMGMPSTVRSLSPRSCPFPVQHTVGPSSFILAGDHCGF